MPGTVQAPALPPFTRRSAQRADYGTEDLRQGFSLDLWFRLDTLAAGQILLDNREADPGIARLQPGTPAGQGLSLQTSGRGTIELILNDGRTENRWECDPGILQPDTLHHMVVTADGGPKVITFVVDGRLCDGGEYRQFGWGRFSPHLRHANSGPELRIGPRMEGEIRALRIYGRALRTSEAVSNFRLGSP
jgi:hypothetical protein